MDKNLPAVSHDPAIVISVPLESLSHDLALTHPFYVKVNDQFVLFRKSGDSVTEKRASALTEKFADVVYIHKSYWQEFLGVLEKKQLVNQKEEGAGNIQSQLNTRHLCLVYLKDIEAKHELFRHELKRYKAAADRLAFIVDNEPRSAKLLVKRFHDVSIYYANHSVNTTIYSLALGKQLGFDLEKLKTLSLATLLHNIGNLQVPFNVLLERKTHTSHQLSQFRMHTIKGADLLAKTTLSTEIGRVASEHHESINGSGYPLGISGNQMSLFSKICALAETYEELLSLSPWNNPLEIKEAKFHLKAHQEKYDPELLELLFKFDF